MANAEVVTTLRGKHVRIFTDKVIAADNNDNFSVLSATLTRFLIILKEDGLSSSEDELVNNITCIEYDDGIYSRRINL